MAQFNGQALRNCLADYVGVTVEDAGARMRETLLMMDGQYCGRRFSLDGFTLTWFLEENQVKLVGPNGQVMAATDPQAFLNRLDQRRAA